MSGPRAPVARVAALYRYPVKSLLGEWVEALEVDRRGVVGDRLWSVRTPDGKIGSGKTTRRFTAVPGLLELRSWYDGERAVIGFPDGTSCPADDRDAARLISAHLGRPVTLARESDVSHFDDGPVSLLGLGSVTAVTEARGEAVEAARFRANVVLDTATPYAEENWMDREVRIGTAAVRVLMRSPRCVMVNMSSADLPAQPGNLALISRINDGNLGVIATVARPGRIEIGAEIAAADAPGAGRRDRRRP